MCDMPSVFNSKTRKARKSHKCCECSATINKGDSYRFSSGIWDDGPASYKQCGNCGVICEWAVSEDAREHGDGVGFGELREWFLRYECLDFNGAELLISFAKEIGVPSERLNLLLKIETEQDA